MQSKRKKKKLNQINQTQCLPKINGQYFIYLILFCLFLSAAAIGFNTYIFQYYGNDYIVEGNFGWILITFLIYFGTKLLFGQEKIITLYVKEFLCFFLIFNVMLLMTYAVQFTPFSSIDKHILIIDDLSHTHLSNIITWTYEHDLFRKMLIIIYESISYQMMYIPLIMILFKRFQPLSEYYFMLIATMLIGFIIYYFFPTTAPASIIDNPYFTISQKATGLKFQQIHQHLKPTTMDGGLIALPSFHVIWAYLSLYLIRGWPLMCWILFPINGLMALSCIFLGWHYPIDLIGSAIVICLAHGLLHCFRTKQITTNRSPLQVTH